MSLEWGERQSVLHWQFSTTLAQLGLFSFNPPSLCVLPSLTLQCMRISFSAYFFFFPLCFSVSPVCSLFLLGLHAWYWALHKDMFHPCASLFHISMCFYFCGSGPHLLSPSPHVPLVLHHAPLMTLSCDALSWFPSLTVFALHSHM